jgi:alpha-glucosidase
MPMVADEPEAYEGQPGFEFIVDVPTTWDETRFVAGEMGEYVVVSRRKFDAWYLGGVTNWDAREVMLPLKFLGDGPFEATLYTDKNGSHPNELEQTTRDVTSADSLSVKLVSGGGVAAVFKAK